MSSYQDFKSFYQSNILLFIILLFVIVYVGLNWDHIKQGDYFGGQYVKPILITGIVFLISHMLITWDDNNVGETNMDENMTIPKYRFKSNIDNNSIRNDIIGSNPALNYIPQPTPNLNPNQTFTQQIPTQLNTIPIQQTQQTQPTQQIPTQPIPTQFNQTQPMNISKPFVPEPQSLNSKYRIVNKFDNNLKFNPQTNLNPHTNFNNHGDSDNRLSNRNIFITHKNSSKYGLKF